MSWGVENLDVPSRIALAINNGVDIISGAFSVNDAKIAYERGINGYYTTQGNKVPEGYTADQLVLSEETLTRAVTRTLEEQFSLGLFDNPYKDPQEALKIVNSKEHQEKAYDCHLKSVVLLKNKENKVLPLSSEKRVNKKIYIKVFQRQKTEAKALRKSIITAAIEEYGMNIAETPEEANFSLLFISPSSGNYFFSTEGYLELDICENKEVVSIDKGI